MKISRSEQDSRHQRHAELIDAGQCRLREGRIYGSQCGATDWPCQCSASCPLAPATGTAP